MKQRRLLAMLLCIISVCAVFSSCGKSEIKAFYFGVSEPAATFDPTIAASGTAKLIVRNCFEGLVYTDGNGNAVPGAAKEWTVSPDGLTYTFTLRENAKWHITSNAQKELKDKLPENFDLSLTAKDFVFGLKRGVEPSMGAADAHLLECIAGARDITEGKASPDTLGVKALSDRVLEIRLAEPCEDFLTVLSEPICMPCNEVFFNACGGRYGLFIRNSLSNGPFYLSFFDENGYRISKNPDYEGEHTAKADVIRFYVSTEQKPLFEKLKNEDYTGAFFDEAAFSEFEPTKKLQWNCTPDKTRCFILNTEDSVLSDENLRSAFIFGTDVESLAAYAEKQPVFSPLPPALFEDVGNDKSEYNPEKALEAIKKALENADKGSFTVTLKCERKYETFIKKQLQNWQSLFGTVYTLNIEVLSPQELKRDVESGNYQIAFYPVGTPSASPSHFFSQFLSSSPDNIWGLKSSELDAELCHPPAKNTNSDQALNKKLDALKSCKAILPVWSEGSYFVYSKELKDVIILPGKDSVYFYNCDTNHK